MSAIQVRAQIDEILTHADAHERLSEYLQQLAYERRICLSTTRRYTDLYIDNERFSSLWHMPDNVPAPEHLLHHTPMLEDQVRFAYWASFRGLIYPFSTIFHLDDLE
jgi:hypothetical protein